MFRTILVTILAGFDLCGSCESSKLKPDSVTSNQIKLMLFIQLKVNHITSVGFTICAEPRFKRGKTFFNRGTQRWKKLQEEPQRRRIVLPGRRDMQEISHVQKRTIKSQYINCTDRRSDTNDDLYKVCGSRRRRSRTRLH